MSTSRYFARRDAVDSLFARGLVVARHDTYRGLPTTRLVPTAEFVLTVPVTLYLSVKYPPTYPDAIPELALEQIDEELGELREGEEEIVLEQLRNVVSACPTLRLSGQCSCICSAQALTQLRSSLNEPGRGVIGDGYDLLDRFSGSRSSVGRGVRTAEAGARRRRPENQRVRRGEAGGCSLFRFRAPKQ
jgi:hypothetical protein